jgi:hypothetical protein
MVALGSYTALISFSTTNERGHLEPAAVFTVRRCAFACELRLQQLPI